MCMRHNMETAGRILKDLMHRNIAFGGKAMLFRGDFRQILPVVPLGSRARIAASCLKSSHIFPLLDVL